jgi:hypothetical protein
VALTALLLSVLAWTVSFACGEASTRGVGDLFHRPTSARVAAFQLLQRYGPDAVRVTIRSEYSGNWTLELYPAGASLAVGHFVEGWPPGRVGMWMSLYTPRQRYAALVKRIDGVLARPDPVPDSLTVCSGESAVFTIERRKDGKTLWTRYDSCYDDAGEDIERLLLIVFPTLDCEIVPELLPDHCHFTEYLEDKDDSSPGG